jgi:prolipoprotein diacylglyceryl transferase
MQHPLAFPSPSQGVWHLGPFPLRAYALMIILGIVVAVWLGERRWAARGGTPGVVIDIAVWAVPFGLVGGRLYHVITDNQMYFGTGRHPLDAFKVWNGGLGIWGAVALGALGAYIGCRRRGVNLRVFADSVAPGIALAQGIGRWGNWFNQELYGRPTSLPWAVTIDQDHRPRLPDGSLDPHYADIAHYHPTFLYESLWCFGVAILVIWAGKRFKLNYGRTFALYVAAYTVGRAWIEWLRIDNAHHFLGLRLNDYTALIVFLGAVAYLYVYRGKGDVEEVAETRSLAELDGHEPVEKPAEPAAVPADHAEPAEGVAALHEEAPAEEPWTEVEAPIDWTPAEEPQAAVEEPDTSAALPVDHAEPVEEAAAVHGEEPVEEAAAVHEEEPEESDAVPVDHAEPADEAAAVQEEEPAAERWWVAAEATGEEPAEEATEEPAAGDVGKEAEAAEEVPETHAGVGGEAVADKAKETAKEGP